MMENRSDRYAIRFGPNDLLNILTYKSSDFPRYQYAKRHSAAEIRKRVLTSSKIVALIKEISHESGSPVDRINIVADNLLREIEHKKGDTALRIMWYMLKEAIQHSPVILAPVHRSYVDFILISYALYVSGISAPAIAAGQDFMSMTLVSILLRRCGAFFMRRSFGDDRLYWAIFNEYLCILLSNGDSPVEIFIEGTRSRTAKSLPPKLGLLKEAARTFFECRAPDLLICPISITYEKIVEESLHAWELLGVPKPPESTSGLLKARSILTEQFGSVHLHFGQLVSLKEFSRITNVDRSIHALYPRFFNIETQSERRCIKQLAYHLIDCQREKLLATSCSLLSTVVLQHLDGVQFEKAVAEVKWLREEIIKIKGIAAIMPDEEDCVCITRRALELMHDVFLLTSDDVIVVKSQYNDSDKALKAKQRPLLVYDTIFAIGADHLLLSRQRNKIIHFFAPQGLAALVIWSLSKGGEMSVSVGAALQDFSMLCNLFNEEFVLPFDLNNEKAFIRAIRLLQEDNVKMSHVLSYVRITKDGYRLHNFLCELMRPFVVSYWVACQYILTNLDGLSQFPLKAACQGAQQLAIDYINGGLFKYYEVLSLSLYTNAFNALHKSKIISKFTRNRKELIYLNKLKRNALLFTSDKLADYGNLRRLEKSRGSARIYSKY